MTVLSPQNVYFVEDGQTEILLDTPYLLDGSLQVFLNGMLAVRGDDYYETSTLAITFAYQLASTDVVITQQQTVVNQSITVINDSPKESLYKKYGDEETLLPNQKYTLRLKHMEQEFTSTFFTKLTPYYSNIPLIHTDLGDVISTVPDDRIMMLIYNNSILANNIASEENLELLETEPKIPYVFKQFVRYRTELDLMMAIYLQLSGRQGSVNKILGELEIKRQYSFGSMNIDAILDDLKRKLKEWEGLLRGKNRTIASSAVRGGKETYPLTTPRRTFATPPGAATSEE